MRQVFFSFHYMRDVWRVSMVWTELSKSWKTKVRKGTR